MFNIREYATVAVGTKGESISAGQEPAVTQQQIAVGNASAPFDRSTTLLRLHAEEATRIEFGATPSAGPTSTFRLAAGQTEFVGLKWFSGCHLDTSAG